MANEDREPVRPRYGRVPGSFARPKPRVEAGACPTCGAFPPCELPKPKEKP